MRSILFYLVGKTGSGKSSLFKQIINKKENNLNLKPFIRYTNRPIRIDESYDIDYHFIKDMNDIDINEFVCVEKFNTDHGEWYYMSKQLDKDEHDQIYIAQGSLDSYIKHKECINAKVIPIYIYSDDRDRIKRMINREFGKPFPDIKEMFRRAYNDEKDYENQDFDDLHKLKNGSFFTDTLSRLSHKLNRLYTLEQIESDNLFRNIYYCTNFDNVKDIKFRSIYIDELSDNFNINISKISSLGNIDNDKDFKFILSCIRNKYNIYKEE